MMFGNITVTSTTKNSLGGEICQLISAPDREILKVFMSDPHIIRGWHTHFENLTLNVNVKENEGININKNINININKNTKFI